jgi:hypothetical protein
MPRPQFTLKTTLWLVVVVAAFFGGRMQYEFQHRRKVRRFQADERALEQIVTDERLRGWHQTYLRVKGEMRAAQDAEDGITEMERIERALSDFNSRWRDE